MLEHKNQYCFFLFGTKNFFFEFLFQNSEPQTMLIHCLKHENGIRKGILFHFIPIRRKFSPKSHPNALKSGITSYFSNVLIPK